MNGSQHDDTPTHNPVYSIPSQLHLFYSYYIQSDRWGHDLSRRRPARSWPLKHRFWTLDLWSNYICVTCRRPMLQRLMN